MEPTELVEYRGELRGCQCLQLPAGTLLRDTYHRAYTEHFVYVAEGKSWDAAGYYLCRNTGVLWIQTYLSGERIEEIGWVRTSCRQLPQEVYTIAKGTVQLYSTPLYPSSRDPRRDYQLPRGVSPPSFPKLPLQGLFYESFLPRSEVAWECEEIRVHGRVFVNVWLRLLNPLLQGETGACWLASPLEVISQQVLRSGLVWQWWFAGGQIGEVRVEEQLQISASRFWEWFGFDKPYRDTGEEFVAWLKAARRRGRRRG